MRMRIGGGGGTDDLRMHHRRKNIGQIPGRSDSKDLMPGPSNGPALENDVMMFILTPRATLHRPLLGAT